MKVNVTTVTQTANKLLGTEEKTMYFLILEEGTEKLVINIGKKTHDRVLDLTKTKAETANVPIAGKQMEATTASLTQGIQNQKAQEELTRVQSELTKVQASVARQTINDAMQTIENTAKQGTEILRGLKLQNDLSEQQFNDKLKLLKSEIGTIAVKNALMHAQRKNTDQDTKNKIQEILESEQRIKTMVNQIMIAWDKLSLETTGTSIQWNKYLDTQINDDFDFLKDLLPGIIIPVGKGFQGGTHKPVTGFR